MTPQFVDFDKDGILDVITGCYAIHTDGGGTIQWLKGKGGDQFEKPRKVRNEAGKLLIPRDRKKNNHIATHPFMADLNADGVLDVVIGGKGGKFYSYQGKLIDGKQSFSEGAEYLRDENGELLAVRGMGAPQLVDWDGDGDLDLVSGSQSSEIAWAENVGNKQSPSWKKFKVLIPAGHPYESNYQWSHKPSSRGAYSRIWVEDVNADGLLDIIAGEHVTEYTLREGFTEEWLEQRPKVRLELEKQMKLTRNDSSLSEASRKLALAKLQKQLAVWNVDYSKKSSRAHVWLILQKKK